MEQDGAYRRMLHGFSVPDAGDRAWDGDKDYAEADNEKFCAKKHTTKNISNQVTTSSTKLARSE